MQNKTRNKCSLMTCHLETTAEVSQRRCGNKSERLQTAGFSWSFVFSFAGPVELLQVLRSNRLYWHSVTNTQPMLYLQGRKWHPGSSTRGSNETSKDLGKAVYFKRDWRGACASAEAPWKADSRLSQELYWQRTLSYYSSIWPLCCKQASKGKCKVHITQVWVMKWGKSTVSSRMLGQNSWVCPACWRSFTCSCTCMLPGKQLWTIDGEAEGKNSSLHSSHLGLSG